MMKRLNHLAIQHPLHVLIGALLLYGMPTFFIGPAGDDWATTRPIWQFATDLLRPDVFWRPIEKLFRWLAGQHTGLHPWLFHLLAVLGHVGSTLMLFFIGRKIHKNIGPDPAAATLFAVFPGNAAAVWSVDSGIQTFSTFFGLLALWCLVHQPDTRGRILALCSATVAVMWKESGIAWFAAAPLFAMMLQGRHVTTKRAVLTSNNLKTLALGLASAALYFVARKALATDLFMGAGQGKYLAQINPIIWLKNATMLVGISMTTVDTVSLFGTGQRWLAGLTLLAGLPLLVWASLQVFRPLNISSLLPGVAGVLAVVSPHLLVVQVSEMYAHPVAAAIIVLFLGVLSFDGTRSQLAQWPFIAAIVVSLIVAGHKWVHMYQTGMRAHRVAERVLNHYDGTTTEIPDDVCTLPTSGNTGSGYSVFLLNASSVSLYGHSIWSLTRWQRPSHIHMALNADDCPSHVQAVWRVAANGDVTVKRRVKPPAD